MPKRAVCSVAVNAEALLDAMSARAMTSKEAAEILQVQMRAAQRYLARLIEDGDVIRLGWTQNALYAVRDSYAAEAASHLPTLKQREDPEPRNFTHRIVPAETTKPCLRGPRWVFDASASGLAKRRDNQASK